MGRKANSNTFTEGLNTDFNPINTPNTMLTDCVNGTIITYNGNEFSLQNDMGNYALKNCKLKENYIPVGLKEYGDILYIVSYNPLDKKVEIGSYPSPQTINSPDGKDGLSQEVNSITPQLEASETDTNYRDIVEDLEKLTVFYGDNPEDYKLYPGDQYQISFRNGSPSDYPYEKLEYYALDDNRKLYNITDFIQTTPTYDPEDGYNYIKWDVPGWIGFKPRFASIDDFRVNVRKIIVPTYSTIVTAMLNFQLFTSDPIFTEINGQCHDLCVDVEIYKDTTSSTNVPIWKSDDHGGPLYIQNRVIRGDGTHIYYLDFNPADEGVTISCESDDILYIKVTPKLKIWAGEDQSHNPIYKYVIYDEYIRTLSFNIGQKGDPSVFDIGVERWWYKVDKEENVLTLQFDTIGLENSAVLSEDVNLFYSIKRPDGSFVKIKQEDGTYVECNHKPYISWNLIGETVSTFPMEPFTEESYTEDSTKFYPEDIYIFEFGFYSDPDGTHYLNNTKQKLVVASELMNDLVDEGYVNLEDVPFNQWINKYQAHIQNKSILAYNFGVTPLDASEPVIEDTVGYHAWKENYSDKYTTFFASDVVTETFKDGFTVRCTKDYNINYTYTSDVTLLTGPLWNLLNNSTLLKYLDANATYLEHSFDIYTGKQVGSSHTTSGSGSVALVDTYKVSPIDTATSLISYSADKPVTYNTAWIKARTYPYANDHDKRRNCVLLISSSADQKEREQAYGTDQPRNIIPIKTLMDTAFQGTDILVLSIMTYRSDGNESQNGHGHKTIHLELWEGSNKVLNDEDRKTQYKWYAAFRVIKGGNNYLGLVPLPNVPSGYGTDAATGSTARLAVAGFADRLKKITLGDTLDWGYFCEAVLSEDRKSVCSINSGVSGTVEFSSFTYYNKDMLDQEARLSLLENFNYLSNKSNFISSAPANPFTTISLLLGEYSADILSGFNWDVFISKLDIASREVQYKSEMAQQELNTRNSDKYLAYEPGTTIYDWKSGQGSAMEQGILTDLLQNHSTGGETEVLKFTADPSSGDVKNIAIADVAVNYSLT